MTREQYQVIRSQMKKSIADMDALIGVGGPDAPASLRQARSHQKTAMKQLDAFAIETGAQPQEQEA